MNARQTIAPGQLGERREAAVAYGEGLAYLVLSFGLLLIVAYRSFVQREPSWDLLALVVIGGVVRTVAQRSRRPLERGDLLAIGLTIGVAIVLGALIGLGVPG